MSLNITSETRSDRKQQRDIQEARQAGTIAPATDVVTGQIINPHNPEFITKRPWYLQDGNSSTNNNNNIDAPSLQHQTNQRPDKDKRELTLSVAEELLQKQRQKEKILSSTNKFIKGQWVEALKRNKPPYRICQVIKVHTTGNTTKTPIIDIQFEDGTIETKIKVKSDSSHPRVRKTVTGNRYLLTSTATAATVSAAVPTNTNDPNENGFIESFVSKRDQYHGYDLDQHNATLVRKYEQKNEIRRKIREKQQREEEEKQKKEMTINHSKDNDNDSGNASDASDDSDSDVEGNDGNHHNNNDYDTSDDEFVQRDEDDKVLTTRLARQGGVGGAQMKVTARNLRIREDTAKYLHNLDVNSAYYDPKSRSMRDNPHPQYKVPGRDVDYAGDNFIRISGDAVALAQQQLFAWDAAEKLGNSTINSTDDNNNIVTELHPQANPSQVELLQKQFQGKVNQIQIEAKRNILSKYGGAEYLDGNDGLASAIPKQQQQQDQTQKLDPAKHSILNVGNDDVPSDRQLRFGVSTQVELYSRDGRLMTSSQNESGNKRKALESKYEENVFINGHTSVWGSYFHKGAFTWGYSDDHSLLKNSYCTGMNGRIANDEANAMQYGTGEAGSATLAQVRKMLPPKNAAPSSSLSSNQSTIMNRSKLYGEVDATIKLDDDKVQEALKRVQQQQSDHNNTTSKRKKYNSNYAEDEMTPEMMEAYRIQKINSIHDPMAKFS